MDSYWLKLAIVLPPTAVLVWAVLCLLSWIWPLLLGLAFLGWLALYVSLEPGLPKDGQWPREQ